MKKDIDRLKLLLIKAGEDFNKMRMGKKLNNFINKTPFFETTGTIEIIENNK